MKVNGTVVISYYNLANVFVKTSQAESALKYYDLGLAQIYAENNTDKIMEQEDFLYAFSSKASTIATNLYQNDAAAIYLMTYFKNTGIDVNSPENLELLTKRSNKYISWSWFMLFTKKVKVVIPTINKLLEYLEKENENIIYLNGNLAHAYILTGDYQAAKAIYTQFKGHIYPNRKSWQEVVLEDFKALKQQGVEHSDFGKIAKEVFAVDEF